MVRWMFVFVLLIKVGLLESSEQPFSPYNQTPYVSTVYPGEDLPFKIDIVVSDLQLPQGLQTYAVGVYRSKWLLITGRTGGVHGFSNGNDNFPLSQHNTVVYVVDIKRKKVYQRSLFDKTSHLSLKQVSSLSVVSAQSKQVGNTLYVVGGYGPDFETGNFNTKSTLTAIDVPKMIRWVQGSDKGLSAKQCIRQIESPIFQVTGGKLDQANPHSDFLLMFGQDFKGFYSDNSNGVYTQQVRTFKLIDDSRNLLVFDECYKTPNPNYNRRDLNVVPIIRLKDKHYEQSFLALSGVFTQATGVWTVPITIDSKGNSSMADPSCPTTFRQGMNNYDSAYLSLFSKKANTMDSVILGGIGYETFVDGNFTFDSEIPFTNNCTDIRIDKNGIITQHLLDATYPEILSTDVNPGNPFLFGAGAQFILAEGVPVFSNGVISLDAIGKKILVGYVVGGIKSTLPNTVTVADSSASSYIFEVFVSPK